MIAVGVLAGILPCGVISMLEELFRAEAKCQVYGSIHSLLRANPVETSEISKLNRCTVLVYYIVYMYLDA